MSKKKINYIPFAIISIIVFMIIIIFLGYKSENFMSSTMPKKQSGNLSSLGNKTFMSTCKYATVKFTTSYDAKTINIKAQFKNLTGVSAIHIHVNNKGKPGPILAWLGTTKEWQAGVAQNTPGANSPCCSTPNPLCSLIAPKGTPYVKDLANTEMTYQLSNSSCNSSCQWIENGVFLIIHGFNFQKVINCKLTNQKPGIDAISKTNFTLVKN